MRLSLATVAILFAASSSLAAMADGELPSVRIMHRVDTTHPHVREVLSLWVDSLTQWRSTQNNAAFLFQSTMRGVINGWFGQDNGVVSRFPPTVLSVDYDGGGWVVRTIFARFETKEQTVIPLGIVRARFVVGTRSNGSVGWVLQDQLQNALRGMDTVRVGAFTYYVPTGHMLNLDQVQALERDANAVATRFGLPMPQEIRTVLMKDRDELCAALGVEYYAFPPQALAFPFESLILESDPTVYRLHEVIHIIFRDYENAHPVLREGIATLLGGTGILDFTDALAQYLDQHSSQRIPSFIELFTGDAVTQDDVYILGGVLCDLVLRYHGRKALLNLLGTERQSDIMITLSALLNLDIADRQGSLRPFAETALERGATGR